MSYTMKEPNIFIYQAVFCSYRGLVLMIKLFVLDWFNWFSCLFLYIIITKHTTKFLRIRTTDDEMTDDNTLKGHKGDQYFFSWIDIKGYWIGQITLVGLSVFYYDGFWVDLIIWLYIVVKMFLREKLLCHFLWFFMIFSLYDFTVTPSLLTRSHTVFNL